MPSWNYSLCPQPRCYEFSEGLVHNHPRRNTVGRWGGLKYVANQGDGRRVPATHFGPKSGDFPIGSLQSRAAARSMVDV
jgi:hypothetical protein